MESENVKQPAPPYVAYRTLANFLERFKQVVPGRIDSKLIGNSMSGGVRGQIIAALKSLRLISDAGVPSETMKRLCNADGVQRQELLKSVLVESYPFVFSDGFNFATATSSQLREVFEEHTNASGETVTRCMSFLKEAAADAGITVSPFFAEQKGRAAFARKKTPRKASSQNSEAQSAPEYIRAQSVPSDTIPAQESLLLWGLFKRLPKPGAAWSKIDRDQWTATLNNVLSMEYKEPTP
ncbi:MAG TPA: DUF5343 domain-containing protein [Chthoniobacterales bacterium]|jgi:hypothetical protein